MPSLCAQYPSEKEDKKVKLRQSGGQKSIITKELILETIELYYKDWRSKVIIFPFIPDLIYDGPIGFPGVPAITEQRHQGNIKGQNTEALVLKIYYEFATSKSRALKFFHSVPLKSSTLKQLGNVFSENHQITQIEEFEEKWELEVDIIAVDSISICLTEVKSSANESALNKAVNQLTKAEHVIRNILKMFELNLSIKRVIAVPGPFSEELGQNTRSKGITLLDLSKDDNEKTLTYQSSISPANHSGTSLDRKNHFTPTENFETN